MTSFDSRPWFENDVYRESLEQKIADGWYIRIVYSNGSSKVGRVKQIIYAGYKVELVNGVSMTTNPNQDKIEDFENKEVYDAATIQWLADEEMETETKRQAFVAEQAILTAKLAAQNACLHENIKENRVVKVAGCDIDDTVCVDCGKELRRSWSTAYEKDPDDMITDWDWWLFYPYTAFPLLFRSELLEIQARELGLTLCTQCSDIKQSFVGVLVVVAEDAPTIHPYSRRNTQLL